MTPRPPITGLTAATQCRRTSMLVLLVAAAVSWVGLGAAPAAAQTELRSSTPADGQHLAGAPEVVELVFDQPIADKFARVVARTSPGGPPTELAVVVDGARVSATVPPDLTAVPPLNRTVWTVSYRVVSEDGHPITGQLRFTVAPAPATTASPESNPPQAASTDAGSSSRDIRGSEAGDGGGQALATLVIGLFTAVTTVGLMYLLARGRNRGDQPRARRRA